MISVHLVEYLALAAALTGLAAVIWEVATTDAGLFREILTDVRGLAEAPLPHTVPGFTPASVVLSEGANSNAIRKAA